LVACFTLSIPYDGCCVMLWNVQSEGLSMAKWAAERVPGGSRRVV
jgi:hypothetical protein